MSRLLQRQKLEATRVSFSTIFNGALDVMQSDPVEMLGMEVTSDSESEEYDWLGTVPGLSEWLDDRPIELTPSEFRLLDTLIRQPGRAFDRTELIDAALGADTLVLERTVDVHVRALRKKLSRAADLIETVRGVGYRFRETPAKVAIQ